MGGGVSLEQRYIAPTVFKDVQADDTLMTEEIFGPLLPTISYQSIEEIDNYLSLHPKPLAFYVFSKNQTFANQLIHRYAFGGGCINDVVSWKFNLVHLWRIREFPYLVLFWSPMVHDDYWDSCRTSMF